MALPLRTDVAGALDGAAGAQAVLGERGRAGAGAGDDREGATVGELAGRRTRELVGHTGRVGKHRKGGRPAPLPLI